MPEQGKKHKLQFNLQIDKQKSKDTGLALVLILLLLQIFTKNETYATVAVIVLVVDMIYPLIYKPVAYIWFGFAHIMGTIVSKVLLFIVYSIIVVPVALIRRSFGKDTLKLRQWKQNNQSVFLTRNHQYTTNDIQKPY
ncbi:MAG: hypothetical protein K8S16_11240 [Bacteroidales bacterium]|nr:hypothetical protein [Bacteroidales bacterium]